MNPKFKDILECPQCHDPIVSEWKCAQGHVYPKDGKIPCFNCNLTEGTRNEINAARKSLYEEGGLHEVQNLGVNGNVLYASIIEDILKVSKGKDLTFLELGSGFETLSYNLALACPSSTIVGTDIILLPEIPWGKPLDNYLRLECAIQSLPFKDSSIDIIFIKSALHHAENLPRTFSEMRRVIKKEGTILAFNEITKSFFEKSDHSAAHNNGFNDQTYSVSDYRRAAADSGLDMNLCFPKVLEMFFDSPPEHQFSGRKNKIRILKFIKKARLLWLIRLIFPVVPYFFIVPVTMIFKPSNRK